MEKKTQVSYDLEEDILSLVRSKSIRDSIRINDVILDLNNDSNIVGIEIFNARRFFKSVDASKHFLSNITKGTLRIYQDRNWVSVVIVLHSRISEKPLEKELSIPSFEKQNVAVLTA